MVSLTDLIGMPFAGTGTLFAEKVKYAFVPSEVTVPVAVSPYSFQ